METLCAASLLQNSNWFVQESKSSIWTKEENKKFESALAIFDKDTPDRWLKVAAMIPGKSVMDVIKQYNELVEDVSHIEAGLIPVPGYLASSFALELVDNHSFDVLRKRSSAPRPSDHERKKGVPWTPDEHRRFLLGLEKHGKGDWRNISRNFVVSKTPTQVASHAQKYFIRQNSGGKDKRRPSIHDITTVNLRETYPSDNTKSSSLDQSVVLPPKPKCTGTPNVLFDWNNSDDGALLVFESARSNLFVQSPYEIASHGLKLQGQNLYSGAHIGSLNSVFPVQSASQQIRG